MLECLGHELIETGVGESLLDTLVEESVERSCIRDVKSVLNKIFPAGSTGKETDYTSRGVRCIILDNTLEVARGGHVGYSYEVEVGVEAHFRDEVADRNLGAWI